MHEIFKQIDAKAIAMIVTSVGGIMLAGMIGWNYYSTVTNHFYHQNETQQETNKVLRDLSVSVEKQTGAINLNTEVLEILDRRLK